MSRVLKILLGLLLAFFLLLAFLAVVGRATSTRKPEKLATLAHLHCPFEVTIPRGWWMMPEPNFYEVIVPEGVRSNPDVELIIHEEHNLSKRSRQKGFLHGYSEVCEFEDRGDFKTDGGKVVSRVFGRCKQSDTQEDFYVQIALMEESVSSPFVMMRAKDTKILDSHVATLEAVAKSYRSIRACSEQMR